MYAVRIFERDWLPFDHFFVFLGRRPPLRSSHATVRAYDHVCHLLCVDEITDRNRRFWNSLLSDNYALVDILYISSLYFLVGQIRRSVCDTVGSRATVRNTTCTKPRGVTIMMRRKRVNCTVEKGTVEKYSVYVTRIQSPRYAILTPVVFVASRRLQEPGLSGSIACSDVSVVSQLAGWRMENGDKAERRELAWHSSAQLLRNKRVKHVLPVPTVLTGWWFTRRLPRYIPAIN